VNMKPTLIMKKKKVIINQVQENIIKLAKGSLNTHFLERI